MNEKLAVKGWNTLVNRFELNAKRYCYCQIVNDWSLKLYYNLFINTKTYSGF